MLIYNYKTSNSKILQIRIKLLETPFVNRWRNYLENLSVKCPHIRWYTASLNISKQTSNAVNNIANLEKLKDSFLYLKNNNIELNDLDYNTVIQEIDDLIIKPELVKQKHLNKWHRIFTGLEMKYLKLEDPVPNYVDRSVLWQHIQDLNGYTHKMEGWTYHKVARREKYIPVKQFSIQFTNAMNLSYTDKNNNVFDQNNIEFIEPGGFDIRKDSYNHTVWLHEDITGKDQMKAWLDEDDLSESDITGNLLMTPSITLDPYKIYQQVLDDSEFLKESLSLNKTVDRYPLGDVIDIQTINWDEFRQSKIISISLDDKKLWDINDA